MTGLSNQAPCGSGNCRQLAWPGFTRSSGQIPSPRRTLYPEELGLVRVMSPQTATAFTVLSRTKNNFITSRLYICLLSSGVCAVIRKIPHRIFPMIISKGYLLRCSEGGATTEYHRFCCSVIYITLQRAEIVKFFAIMDVAHEIRKRNTSCIVCSW